MHWGLMTYMVFLVVIQDVIGFLLNSPCKKTTDWDDYHLQCVTNHKIYLRHHTIEDGFEKLLFPALGCTSKDALYCGADLPNNNTINLQNDVFVNAVKQCNGKTDCILRTDYFTKAEKSVRDSCDTSTHPDLQNAKFRQSMYYECIPESPMLDMCTRSSENRSQHIYLEASSNGSQRNCSCHVTGSASKVEILQIISSQVQIFSNNSFVLGNVAVECNKTNVSTSPLQNTTKTPSQLNETTNTHVTTARHISETTTKEEHNNGSSDHNMKSWTRSLTLVLTAFILVVILLLLISVIQRRKDRDLLLAILLKLDETFPGTDTDHRSATPETNHSEISENDRNYQEISSRFFNHANATQLMNPDYEIEVKSQSGLTSQDVFVSMDGKSDQSLLRADETNGVYELQQRF
uniref:Uncharacterized protein LOC111136863 isoform X2 n=1 Tax=Crassostrea virginica TaxID=6565 RepID=A0A8B8EUV4_CRAVI|nr:uncharacterized protein LOC111136863 isoform X2 [Crassostrea virginica]